jgi:hypothetical protein
MQMFFSKELADVQSCCSRLRHASRRQGPITFWQGNHPRRLDVISGYRREQTAQIEPAQLMFGGEHRLITCRAQLALSQEWGCIAAPPSRATWKLAIARTNPPCQLLPLHYKATVGQHSQQQHGLQSAMCMLCRRERMEEWREQHVSSMHTPYWSFRIALSTNQLS